MFPIKLDLRDLTRDRIAEAFEEPGRCRYAAPCIIGTLIPAALRGEVDDIAGPNNDVTSLVDAGIFEFPNDEQRKDADRLQARFDGGASRSVIEQLAEKYLLASA